MLAFWIGIPLLLRYFILGGFGLLAGALANHVIYTYCWNPRPISPWAIPSDDAQPRRLSDHIPLLGWLGLRRESKIHGTGFWIRPILIELGLMALMPFLYWFETQYGGVLPIEARQPILMNGFQKSLHTAFFGHAVLLGLMCAATFIDFDEQTIPDIITVPGTLFGLCLCSFSVYAFLPVSLPVGGAPQGFATTTFELPMIPATPKWWTKTGLLTGLAIWSGWCFALADRRIILRKGFLKAVDYFFAGLVRHASWKLLAGIWIVGIVCISIVFNIGGGHWHGLFSSLIGLAVGGGVVWAIRIIASAAMGMEAMGFGDVTLMAMIGAFLGWQAAVSAFFLSPFAAIIIVLVQYVITRDHRVPFGPYLCAGAVLTVVFWHPVMNGWFLPNLQMLGNFILWLCLAMLCLMGFILFGIQQLKRLFLR